MIEAPLNSEQLSPEIQEIIRKAREKGFEEGFKAGFKKGFEEGSTDSLTGLPLRHIFERDLAEEIKNGTPVGLGMVDVDYLAFWNLSKFGGHNGGDNILRQTVKILRETTNAQIYRLGGEEFCLIFRDLRGEKQLKEAKKKVGEIKIKDTSIRPGISFGIANSQEIKNQSSDQNLSEGQKITTLKQTLLLMADYRCSINKIIARLLLLASLSKKKQPNFFSAATKGLEGLDYKALKKIPPQEREQKAKEMVRQHFEEILTRETDPLRKKVLNKIMAELEPQPKTQG